MDKEILEKTNGCIVEWDVTCPQPVHRSYMHIYEVSMNNNYDF